MDQDNHTFDELINNIKAYTCPSCGRIGGKKIAHRILLEKVQERIETLHPACLVCDDLFSSCAGTSKAEWDARLNDPEQSYDPFCHDLALWQ